MKRDDLPLLVILLVCLFLIFSGRPSHSEPYKPETARCSSCGKEIHREGMHWAHANGQSACNP